VTPEKEARTETLKALGKLAAALVPLAVAVTLYVEMKTEALRASITITQQATAHETATSSAAFEKLVERLELHESALESLGAKAATLQALTNRQGELLIRHDERISLALSHDERVTASQYVSVSEDEAESVSGPPEEPPLAKLKRTKLNRKRPQPSEATVNRIREQIQDQVQEDL